MIQLAAYLFIGWILAEVFGPIFVSPDPSDTAGGAIVLGLMFGWPVVLPLGFALLLLVGVVAHVQPVAAGIHRSFTRIVPASVLNVASTTGHLAIRTVQIAALAFYGSVALLLVWSAMQWIESFLR